MVGGFVTRVKVRIRELGGRSKRTDDSDVGSVSIRHADVDTVLPLIANERPAVSRVPWPKQRRSGGYWALAPVRG
jgi:hypothetical protein